ncbi:uncharacterized protein BDW70DRAFT_140518 [Aspergillus foveolatus]|uniref:uncharacterized protein n=1 Tax=Aspergillus foveolatus TaxID=210207 RepID=UPI003CCE29E7
MHPARLLLTWVPGPALALVLHALALNRPLPESQSSSTSSSDINHGYGSLLKLLHLSDTTTRPSSGTLVVCFPMSNPTQQSEHRDSAQQAQPSSAYYAKLLRARKREPTNACCMHAAKNRNIV